MEDDDVIGAAIRDRNSRCVGHNHSSELRRRVQVRRGDDGQRFSAQYGDSLRDRVVRAEDDDPVPVLDGKDEHSAPAFHQLRCGSCAWDVVGKGDVVNDTPVSRGSHQVYTGW